MAVASTSHPRERILASAPCWAVSVLVYWARTRPGGCRAGAAGRHRWRAAVARLHHLCDDQAHPIIHRKCTKSTFVCASVAVLANAPPRAARASATAALAVARRVPRIATGALCPDT